MADYEIKAGLQDIAQAIRDYAKVIERTRLDEIACQKREWIQKTGDVELVDF